MSDQWGVGNSTNIEPFDQIVIGKTTYDLIFGQFPHSRSDNNQYARSKPTGRSERETLTIQEFDGHRIRTKIEIEEYNYLKESELSGDQIRKGGSCKIYFNDICCFEFFHRNAAWAAIRASQLVGELKEHSSGWANKKERDKLVDRQIYWCSQPGIIDSLIVNQGCVVIKPDGIPVFKAPPWREEDLDSVKCEVTDGNIWWFRDK